jgi:hypothetical protein
MKTTIADTITGLTETRDMTVDEIDAQKLADKECKERAIVALDKNAARQAVLDRLGITADEAALLLG